MVQCRCSKEGEIAEIHTIVKRLDKILTGNGDSERGLLNDINQMRGILKFARWALPSGIFGIIIGVLAFIRTFK